MYYGTGIVEYRASSVVLLIDREIIRYYRSLIPKYYRINPQKHYPHITIIRAFEKPLKIFKNYETMDFEYDGIIHFKDPYFFINAFSYDIGEYRSLCGLSKFRFGNCYHFTLGNIKLTV